MSERRGGFRCRWMTRAMLTSSGGKCGALGLVLAVTHEQELSAMALWVDREQGEEGERFIAERVFHFDSEDDDGGKQLWTAVARLFVELRASVSSAPN